MMKSKYLVLLLATLTIVAVIFISGCVQQGPQEQPEKNLSFVYAQGTEFMVDGKPFRFVGAFTFPALTHRLYDQQYSLTYKGEIDGYFESLPANVSVVRVFMYSPYIKNFYGAEEPNWERLDYLVESAERHGVYIIWVLYDYWDYGPTGGLLGYSYKFWKDENVKPVIIEQVSRYKDSPAIFGWEIMNEGDVGARTYPGTGTGEREEMLVWVDNVSRAIKTIDNKHLVSTGFSNEDLLEMNFKYPQTYPDRRDFLLRLYRLPEIDFITFHAYGGNPDLQTDPSFFTDQWRSEMSWYLDEMVRFRNEVGKPVVLEEFGTQRQVGESTRKQLYDFMLDQAIRKNMSCLFNAWSTDNYPESCSIYTYDKEYYAVLDAAQRMKNIT